MSDGSPLVLAGSASREGFSGAVGLAAACESDVKAESDFKEGKVMRAAGIDGFTAAINGRSGGADW